MNKTIHTPKKSKKNLERLQAVFNLILQNNPEGLSKFDKMELINMRFTDVITKFRL